MSTVVILYVLRFFVADPMQICLALRSGKHASTTLISNCPIKKLTDLQASCGTQCNKILLPLFWLTVKSICINRNFCFAVFVLFDVNIPFVGQHFICQQSRLNEIKLFTLRTIAFSIANMSIFIVQIRERHYTFITTMFTFDYSHQK